MESLKDYFGRTKGLVIMVTGDSEGKVNAAVYARPHFLDDGSPAFIMRDRLTHRNPNSIPHAAYLFAEQGAGYKGKRLHLTKLREEENTELLQSLSRRERKDEKADTRFLVVFAVDKVFPLIGTGELPSA